MIRSKNKKRSVLLAVLIAVMCLLGLFGFGGGSTVTAHAEDATSYSDVLFDLQKDESFDTKAYPAIADDYSLQVIQIAESENNELFVYVYQPSRSVKELNATELNMSLTDSVENTALYSLTLLNSNGVFCKYLVNGLTVSSEAIRHYNITSIYRAWDKSIDGELSSDNTGDEKAFEVGWLWIAETKDGNVIYSRTRIDVITVTGFYVGHLRYVNKSYFYSTAVDCFYVAFSTDWNIDKLLKASVSFKYCPYTTTIDTHYNWGLDYPIIYSENLMKSHVSKLSYESSTDYVLNGIKQQRYNWKWIQNTEDFMESESLNESAKKSVKSHSWVLRFFSSELKMNPINGGIVGGASQYSVLGNAPREVTILELSFETAGITYDLGAVSDKQSGGLTEDNVKKPLNPGNKFLAWIKKIMAWLFGVSVDSIPDWAAVVFLIVCIIILGLIVRYTAPFMPLIASFIKTCAKGIAKGFMYLFKGLWWLISLPVRGIIALVRRKRGEL